MQVSAERKRFDWREFLILWAAGVWGTVAVFPYALSLQGLWQAHLPPWPAYLTPLIAVQFAQNVLLVAVAVALGLLLARRIGLGAPLLEARLAGEATGGRLRTLFLPSVLVGVVAAVLIIALDLLVFARLMDVSRSVLSHPPAWQGFLASFYGGITEELLMRLFLMSLLAWLTGLVWRVAPGQPASGAFWAANVATTVLFGVGHLPTTAALTPLTPAVVARAIVLNGIAGIGFGYLYWRKGLESAALAHFSADIVLHVLAPPILG